MLYSGSEPTIGSSSPVSNNLSSTMIWPLLSRYKNKMLNFSSVQYFIYWWQNITKQVHSSFCFVYFIGHPPPKKMECRPLFPYEDSIY